MLVETFFSLLRNFKSKVSRLVSHSMDEGTSSIEVDHNFSSATFAEICGNSVRLTHHEQSIFMGELKWILRKATEAFAVAQRQDSGGTADWKARSCNLKD